MTPQLLMQISGGTLFVSLLVVILNFVGMAKGFSIHASNFVLHLLGGVIAGLSGCGLLGGFVWFLVEVAKR